MDVRRFARKSKGEPFCGRAVTYAAAGMAKHRLLLVPWLSALEWGIRPLLEEWADVASFDAPGVGDEPPPAEATREAIAKRGLEELDRLGWDRVTVVADEFGVGTAVALASERPEAIE